MSILEVTENLAAIGDETRKKFDDAIYRFKHDDPRTAADVWAELKVAQDNGGIEWAYRCVGLLNELRRRGQIEDWR